MVEILPAPVVTPKGEGDGIATSMTNIQTRFSIGASIRDAGGKINTVRYEAVNAMLLPFSLIQSGSLTAARDGVSSVALRRST
jgi:hypothetical protein